ncbi:MAG TPA: M14 metallopeptidase family protein [Blastocatellia bacterium]|nr:M14 metallopeptidase family protein [Blastocatellia bacterium]
MTTFIVLLVIAALSAAQSNPAREPRGAIRTARVPAPRDVIGFTPGDDRKLASWSQIVDYFKRLERASDRVKLEELGKTTLGRPFVLATISSPENLARLDRFKEIQRKLADPRTFNSNDAEAEKLIAEGRTIVLITCGIHSTEVGGNLVSMNIAHRLASDDSPETREILDRCIVLLVPSLNPDGNDIVKNWYDKTLGTPAEGTNPPELYHHYTGHDNNRDWYAFTQIETQLTVDKVHNVWRPQIVHDIHQQGDTGSRFFLPPYVDPWEPNVSPILQAGVNFMGSAMAWELTAEGKAGVVIDGVYDAWSPSRAYQHYHGGIRILSETASARIASPTTIPFEKLTPQIGVDPKVRSWNFPLVWPGGEWKLPNIVDYMQAGAFALMRNAARYRERWVRDFYRVGKEAVRERKPGEAFAFLIPPVETPPTTKVSIGTMGRERERLSEPSASDFGRSIQQLKREFDNLPSYVSVQRRKAYAASTWRLERLTRLEKILTRGDVEISEAGAEFMADDVKYPAGTKIILMAQPYGAFAKTLLERQHYPDLRQYPGGPPQRPYDVTAQTLPLLMGINVVQVNKPFDATRRPTEYSRTDSQFSFQPNARVALYRSHAASMDEGWTRWIFDQFKAKYTTILDADIRADNLRAKYDCIVIPAQGSQQIFNGLSRDRYPAELAGGLGQAGVDALKKFAEEGGTIITLNEASQFAIDRLGIPVKNTLEGVPAKDFYCPGSILKIKLDTNSPITRDAPLLESSKDESIAWVEGSIALEPTSDDARVIARFADAKELLLSGWLLGAEKLANKGAIVEAKRGKGRVIMFAFRPQYRGQSIATLPFLFNAISTSATR